MSLESFRKTRWDKLNGTHQLLGCADGVDQLEDNMNTMNKNNF
jgi:hypothetical protein